MEFPEVKQLTTQFKAYPIQISEPFDTIREDLFFVKLTIGSKSWNILIDDEYKDYSKDKPLVNWFLVLYALDAYNECDDILEWSNAHGIASTRLLDYYKALATIYREVEGVIGKIDPCISSYDYSLRTGRVSALSEVNM